MLGEVRDRVDEELEHGGLTATRGGRDDASQIGRRQLGQRVAHPRFEVRVPLIQQLARHGGGELGLAITRQWLPADAIGHREQPRTQGVADQISQMAHAPEIR